MLASSVSHASSLSLSSFFLALADPRLAGRRRGVRPAGGSAVLRALTAGGAGAGAAADDWWEPRARRRRLRAARGRQPERGEYGKAMKEVMMTVCGCAVMKSAGAGRERGQDGHHRRARPSPSDLARSFSLSLSNARTRPPARCCTRAGLRELAAPRPPFAHLLWQGGGRKGGEPKQTLRSSSQLGPTNKRSLLSIKLSTSSRRATRPAAPPPLLPISSPHSLPPPTAPPPSSPPPPRL